MYDFNGKTAVVTGAGGALGGQIAHALVSTGAGVAIWDISASAAQERADELNQYSSGSTLAVECDVVSKSSVAKAVTKTVDHFGSIEFLVNGAGGSHPSTTTSEDLKFFDIDPEATRRVMDLNYLSAVIPSQAIGRLFAQKEAGAIVNITSVGGGLPLSRALAYSNGKAAANSFTQWLAVHMAQEHSAKIRVNAIAPGFMITEQNRFLLLQKNSQELTSRGETILQNVPMGRFGDPQEVTGAVLWLLSDEATFVTGAVIPIDGGFSAFDGV